MIDHDVEPTKILFIENDEAAFQILQCIARALLTLPPIELYHARDASEALAMLDSLGPDVIVIDEDEAEERDLLIDSLSVNHPPIILQTDTTDSPNAASSLDEEITRIPRCESLEGIHETLKVAAALGEKFTGGKLARSVH